ncbi:MAG: DUF393 domain-containing protein [Betaproteobacteria bacterium]|nr:DUF393 domain-containing protein [Betaproteobacteria bacterium]
MKNQHPTIIFDGVCNLCSTFIGWLVLRDKNRELRFATFQSQFAREALKNQPSEVLPSGTVILVEGQLLHTRSDAVLKILGHIGVPKVILQLGLAVPRPLRDALYNFVAKNRYRFFGTRKHCFMPTSEIRERFLD